MNINRSFILLLTVLFECLCLTSSQSLASTAKRPEYAPKAGCKPGRSTTTQCPVRMDCFTDKQFPLGGRCDCNPLWYKIPEKLPFDDFEWDDGFSTNDCRNEILSRILTGGFFCLGCILCVAFIYTSIAVIVELFRNKALKWNATAYSLFLMTFASVCLLFTDMIYTANIWDGDRVEFWYNSRSILFVYGVLPPSALIDFEIGVTWIDLYDRTRKMSKSSSRGLIFLRFFLRLIGFIIAFGFLIYTSTGGLVNLVFSATAPSVTGIIFIIIAGSMIIKTICPDRKDVANPNWKVAESIRRAVKHALGGKVLEIIGLLGMGFTVRHPQLGYMYGWFNVLYFSAYNFRLWGWLHYLIYGSRKHLKRYASESASAYFGFSTIGLNKTVTNLTSAVSSKSTTVAHSTVEKS